jgi:hypothetical protein
VRWSCCNRTEQTLTYHMNTSKQKHPRNTAATFVAVVCVQIAFSYHLNELNGIDGFVCCAT